MLTQVCHFPDVLLFQRKEENQTAVITVASDEHVTCVIPSSAELLFFWARQAKTLFINSIWPTIHM